MNEQEGRDALAREVRVARRRKYRTVTKAVAAAKISRGAWEGVEKGNPAKDFTLAAVEEALGWPPGHAERLKTGDAIGPPLEYSEDELKKLREVIGAAPVDDYLRRRLLGVIDEEEGRTG